MQPWLWELATHTHRHLPLAHTSPTAPSLDRCSVLLWVPTFQCGDKTQHCRPASRPAWRSTRERELGPGLEERAPERELSPCLRMLCADSVTALTLGGVPLGLVFRVEWLRCRHYVVLLGVTELKLGARTWPQALWLWSPCSTVLRDPTSPVSCVQAWPS